MAKTNLLTYLVVFTFIVLVYLVSLYVSTPPTELSVLELIFGALLAIFIVIVAIFAEISGQQATKKK